MSICKKIISTAVMISLFCLPAMAEDDEIYSGVYKGHQLLPNTMATLCKKSAEDMVENPQELQNCVNKLALKRRSSNAEEAREGLKDLQAIKLDQLLEMSSLALVKGASVADYYAETAKEVSEVNTNAITTNDVDGSAVYTTAVLTSVVNSFRDLYVEQLKYLAISNIENIEKDALQDVASIDVLNEAEAQSANKTEDKGSDNSAGFNLQQTTSTLQMEKPATEIHFVDGVCRLCAETNGNWECREQQCPDGQFPDANNKDVIYDCKQGICEKIDIKG